MNAPLSPDPTELNRLEERVRKLAAEKAALELMNRLMARLTALPGLDRMIESMLQSILDTIGGTNIILYYWIDGRLHYADVYGERQELDGLGDADVARVKEELVPLEKCEELAASQLIDSALARAWTWIMPLLVGRDLVGILKVEHCNLPSQEIRVYLPSFLNYAAAVLKNDIFGHTQLMDAYADLTRANAELALAKDAAEAANRSKSVFLANMSHELRTPLNAVLGFAQLLARDSNLTPAQFRSLSAIENSGQHLLELINEVLELSRVEAGKVHLRKEPFDLRHMLTAILDMVQVRAQSKGLELALICRSSFPPQVDGDAYHLKQVLINLLNNAVKYTPSGTVTLTVDWHSHRAFFEVADTGQGITQEEQEKLFQPFYQTSFGMAQNEGTGLGLAISRDYVRLMGGEITVQSTPQIGSRFSFSIPLPGIDTPASANTSQRKVIGLADQERNWRILIVDDDESNRTVLATLLNDVGFETRLAGDGEEALRTFAEFSPHFIWMDSHMPRLDGTEAVRKIRSLPIGKALPIVAMTASAFGEDLDRMLEAGANGYVRKPFRIGEILETLRISLGLQYRFAETVSAEIGAVETLDAAMLSKMPPELHDRLKAALERLDIDDVRCIIENLASEHSGLASAMEFYVDAYRFEDLLQALQQPPMPR
jgi:signal transduction histidine kinase/CheY-like chemotaxis protein